MTIKEFAEQRGVRPNTVSVYIGSHPELFDGHITYEGKRSSLDEVALEHLEAKYPVPKPDVVEDSLKLKELQEREKAYLLEIARLQRKLESMQDELKEKAEAAALAEARQLLIEQKDDQIRQEQERAAAAEARAEKAAEDLRQADQRAIEAEATARVAEGQAEEERRRADQAEEAKTEAEKRAEEKAAEVDQLRSRGLWARILNK